MLRTAINHIALRAARARNPLDFITIFLIGFLLGTSPSSLLLHYLAFHHIILGLIKLQKLIVPHHTTSQICVVHYSTGHAV